MSSFPDNIVQALRPRLKHFMPEWEIIDRPIRMVDPHQSMGVYAMNWVPKEESAQIGQMEPTLATYNLRVQNLVKHTDEPEGRAAFTVAAKTVRAIVARDPDLRVRLADLREDFLNSRERLMRFGVRQQSFLNNDIKGTFTFLATTDLWVETETVQL